MTLLEFCQSFFPGEELFSAGEEGLTVRFCRLLELEHAGQECGQLSWEQVLPSNILYEVQPGRWRNYDPRCGEDCPCCWDGERSFLLTGEALQTLQRLHLVIDPQVVGLEHVRRPYFRVRGRPVTEEQAFDILRRTNMPPANDNLMRGYPWKDLVHASGILDNKWWSWFPQGWVLPDGTVGMNDHSGIKYPCESEIVAALLPLELAFPYLDLVIAITDWDEVPPYIWETLGEGDDGPHEREDYPDFLEHVILGVWLHGDTMELMAPERTLEKYVEYDRLYSGPDGERFKQHYWYLKHRSPIDSAYLSRLIRSHGLDPEEVLAGYAWGSMGLTRTGEQAP